MEKMNVIEPIPEADMESHYLLTLPSIYSFQPWNDRPPHFNLSINLTEVNIGIHVFVARLCNHFWITMACVYKTVNCLLFLSNFLNICATYS